MRSILKFILRFVDYKILKGFQFLGGIGFAVCVLMLVFTSRSAWILIKAALNDLAIGANLFGIVIFAVIFSVATYLMSLVEDME